MKCWAETIRSHIETWSKKLSDRPWWPRYVYHFTDVQNAAGILNRGVLLSRNAVLQHDGMLVDNAHKAIIDRTDADKKEYARLYFRPQTPTQWSNEGIKPADERGDAHCPVPVFFYFRAFDILSDDKCEFCKGNLARTGAEVCADHDSFQAIPFYEVFSEGYLPVEGRDAQVNHRNAEVLFRDELGLEHLEFICCRSEAEKETLRTLLAPTSLEHWSSRIVVAGEATGDPFFRRHLHIDSLSISEREIWVNLHRSPACCKEYTVRVRLSGKVESAPRGWDGILSADATRFSISNDRGSTRRLEIRLGTV
jgi:hypothetical protein